MLPVPGCHVHVAYGEPGQLRVFDVFESIESFEAFGKVLLPMLAETGADPGQPEIWPLYAFGSGNSPRRNALLL